MVHSVWPARPIRLSPVGQHCVPANETQAKSSSNDIRCRHAIGFAQDRTGGNKRSDDSSGCDGGGAVSALVNLPYRKTSFNQPIYLKNLAWLNWKRQWTFIWPVIVIDSDHILLSNLTFRFCRVNWGLPPFGADREPGFGLARSSFRLQIFASNGR